VSVSTVLVVASGKGGVGTSTVAALAALGLAADGRETLLVDGGEHVAALHHLLGAGPARPLGALAGGAAEAAELVTPLIPGLSLVSGAVRAGEGPAPVGAAERQLLERRVAELYPRYDAVVVDAGARLEAVLAACAPADALPDALPPAVLLVTTADPLSVAAAYALTKVLAQRAPLVRPALLVTRADDVAAGAAHHTVSAAAEHFLGRPVPAAGLVPEDATLRRAVLGGMPLHDAVDGSLAADAVALAALALLPRPTAAPAGASHHPRRLPA